MLHACMGSCMLANTHTHTHTADMISTHIGICNMCKRLERMGGALQQAAFDANRCESERQTDTRTRGQTEREGVRMHVCCVWCVNVCKMYVYLRVLVSVRVTRMYFS